jgi:hypothetical protein
VNFKAMTFEGSTDVSVSEMDTDIPHDGHACVVDFVDLFVR